MLVPKKRARTWGTGPPSYGDVNGTQPVIYHVRRIWTLSIPAENGCELRSTTDG